MILTMNSELSEDIRKVSDDYLSHRAPTEEVRAALQ